MSPRVWVERPITSVEDAEGLPVGAIAFSDGSDAVMKWAAADGEYYWGDPVAGGEAAVVDWTALVPVEITNPITFAEAQRYRQMALFNGPVSRADVARLCETVMAQAREQVQA